MAGVETQWPQHVARRITDVIHNDVRTMVANSRLVRNADGISLVQQHQLHVGRILGQGAFSEVHEVQFDGDAEKRTYALKHLKQKLLEHPDNFRLAAAELAVEAHMLASFDHPNIIKVRGWAANGVASFTQGRHDSFFLILDRLDETLDNRIATWQRQNEEWQAQDHYLQQHNPPSQQYGILDFWRRLSLTNTSEHQCNRLEAAQLEEHRAMRQQFREQIYLEKLGVCTEIAAALSYLHNNGVIFRDLKPNNIGFLNGSVKLFDFGLSRELPGLNLKEPFEMSGKVGTLRYMAVEVASHQPYNVAADVYSWAMVSYEVLTLVKPFGGWTRDMHANMVCAKGARPPLVCTENSFTLSSELQHLLSTAWNQHPYRRPCMPTICQKMEQIEHRQLLKVHDLMVKYQASIDQRTPIVELPQDFSVVRKAPQRKTSDHTGGTALSAESLEAFCLY